MTDNRPGEQEPVEGVSTHGGRTFDHPAFGQISISRVSANPGAVLYGTDFRHHAYVMVTIHRSRLTRDLSRDWAFPYEEVVRLALSEAQWAAFVSSFSVGGGVQCTLQHVGLKALPGIPYRDSGQEYRIEADAKLASAIEELRGLKAELEAGVAKLPKATQAGLLARVSKAITQLASNLPFVSRQFGEHMETRVEKARAEIHGHMSGLLARAGLEHLRGQAPLEIGQANPPAP